MTPHSDDHHRWVTLEWETFEEQCPELVGVQHVPADRATGEPALDLVLRNCTCGSTLAKEREARR